VRLAPFFARLKSEIAQRQLSDLWREIHAYWEPVAL
jgi:hypothetical protein